MAKDDPLTHYRALERELAALIGPLRFDPSINLRLERITHLLDLLGNPQRAFRSIHVGGTSGKGSTATMTAAILTAAGYRSGLYLSPHLQVLNECYQIDQRMVATTQLYRLFQEIKPAIAQVAQDNPFGRPSYFEAQTALAFLLFQRECVDVAVVEVGLGGGTDATNVLPAEVAVLTSVGLDHTAILGDTLEAIAQVKVGIIKPGQTVVSGVSQPAIQRLIAERCAAQGATLWQLGQDLLQREEGDGFTLGLPGKSYHGIRLKLLGDFQASNAACAIAAAHALSGGIPETAVREALRRITLPGRLEIVQQNPTVILDGAHNPAKMRASARTIQDRYADRRQIVVLALKSDKDYRRVLPYVTGAAQLILTTFEHKLWESLPPKNLAQAAREIASGLDVRIVPDPLQAVQAALSEAGPDDLVWVTGSLYLVGNVRGHWYPPEELLRQAGAAPTSIPR